MKKDRTLSWRGVVSLVAAFAISHPYPLRGFVPTALDPHRELFLSYKLRLSRDPKTEFGATTSESRRDRHGANGLRDCTATLRI